MAARLLAAAVVLSAMLHAQPRRIVSAAPAITETLFALGLGDRVVAVTDYCRYPAEAIAKPKIGGYTQPNIEAIAALRPDLVIIERNPIQLGPKLEAMKLKVLEIPAQTIADIPRMITAVAAGTGAEAAGAKLAQNINRELDEIRRKTNSRPRRRVLFVVGRSANSLEGMMAVGGSSYLNDLISVAGGVNIFEKAVAAYPRISLEQVIGSNPDVILDMGDMAQTAKVTEDHKRRAVALWKRHPVLNARVFAIASDVYVVPGPRIAQAAREFARMLHPEAGL
jgi:iron complex transport system substrate-binding protein